MNAFAYGYPSVAANLPNLTEGWYGIQIVAWPEEDFEYNVNIYADSTPIHFMNGTTQISTEVNDLFVAEEGEITHDEDYLLPNQT